MSNATQVPIDGIQESNNATSKTTFGRSVESRAQIEDASIIATSTDPGEVLNVYRLIAVAAPDDPIWQGAVPKREVIVAARTAGDARVVAAGMETDFVDFAQGPAEDVTTVNASLFRKEKAYTVVEVEHAIHGLRRGPLPN
jgi:hypothetical protein